MSWFGPSIDRLHTQHDSACDDEVEDGVIVTRRRLLWGSASATGALLLAPQIAAQEPRPRQDATDQAAGDLGDLDLDEFLASMFGRAKTVITSDRHEDAYLFQVADMIARLQNRAESPRAKMRAFRDKHRVDGERFPIHVTEMKLKPGARLKHHDHRDYNGVIVGIDGEVRIKNFDILGANPTPAEGETFQIRETQDTLISDGQYSMLARKRNNVHDLVAGPEGGRVLDVFTFFAKGATSHFMDVETQPRDADRRIYDAAWRPRRKRK